MNKLEIKIFFLSLYLNWSNIKNGGPDTDNLIMMDLLLLSIHGNLGSMPLLCMMKLWELNIHYLRRSSYIHSLRKYCFLTDSFTIGIRRKLSVQRNIQEIILFILTLSLKKLELTQFILQVGKFWPN